MKIADIARFLTAALLPFALGGCVVASVADTAADVAGTAISTTADVATAPVDLVVGDDDDDDDDD